MRYASTGIGRTIKRINDHHYLGIKTNRGAFFRQNSHTSLSENFNGCCIGGQVSAILSLTAS
jgi:hypothetical protein